MKRIIFCVLAVLILAGCSKIPAETSQEMLEQDQAMYLTLMQNEIAGQNKLIGVAYLGWADGDYTQVMKYLRKQPYIDRIPFIGAVEQDHFCQNDGSELYCVVPVDKSVSLSVCKAEFNESYELYPGEELLNVSDGQAVILRGNISEIAPNLVVIANDGTQIQEYMPCRSGADGYLVNQAHQIYDFTPYGLMEEFLGTKRELEEPLSGSWTASVTDSQQGAVDMELSLKPEGGLSYCYCIGGQWCCFSGSWEILMDGNLRLMMWGGPVDENGNLIPEEADEIDGCYVWENEAEGLKLQHKSGLPLYPSALVTDFTFIPVVESGGNAE